jgi:uncharacterized protein (UPF0335 family)
MTPEEADDPDAEEFAFHDVSIDVPTRWLHSVDGFSGHAAANDLLEFARETEAPSVSLVHGDLATGEHLKEHIASNTDAESVSVAERGEPIHVGQTGAIPDDLEQLQQRHDRLENEMESLAEEIERLEHERVKIPAADLDISPHAEDRILGSQPISMFGLRVIDTLGPTCFVARVYKRKLCQCVA